MTLGEMRVLLGLGEDVSDPAVAEAYLAYLGGDAATAERLPVSLADARRQLRMEEDDTSRDGGLVGFIADAMAWVEDYTGHILVAQDVSEEFGGFGRLRLRAWPIKPGAAVTVTYGAGSSSVTVPGARIGIARRPVDVVPAFGASWPSLRGGSVVVTVRAGYEPGDTIPGNMRRAMLVLIGGYDEGTEALVLAEQTARSLCRGFRARSL